MKKIIIATIFIIISQNNAFSINKNTAILVILDKVTTKTKEVHVPVNSVILFKTLDINIKKCDKNPPEDIPESAAYIIIKELSIKTIFKGWMFASNPSINSLEHAVYDIWVKDCIDK